METRTSSRVATFASGLILGVLLIGATSERAEAYDVTGSGGWGASDAMLGITGWAIEDFEDLVLLPGLSYESTGSGVLTALDNTFDPALQDPYGTILVMGVWDGSRVLINTVDNQAKPYPISGEWGVITFYFAGGTGGVGFSLEQMQSDVQLVINGVPQGGLLSLTGLLVSNGHNGYVVIRAEPGDPPIESVSIDNSLSGIPGDGYAFDHLAVAPPAVPLAGGAGLVALAGGLVAVALRMGDRRHGAGAGCSRCL